MRKRKDAKQQSRKEKGDGKASRGRAQVPAPTADPEFGDRLAIGAGGFELRMFSWSLAHCQVIGKRFD